LALGGARPAWAANDPKPTDPIYAILSPTALPACQLAGTATLLVPIVGGLVESKLQLPTDAKVADLILQSLGPVYVVCGSLPAPKGSRCELDDQIAGLLPSQLDVVQPTPSLLGSVTDAVNAGLKALGLEPLDAFKSALQCTVRAGSAVTPAPPELPPPPAAPQFFDPGTGEVTPFFGAVDTPLPSLREVLQTPGSTSRIASVVRLPVPGWVEAMRGAVVVLLATFLGLSWARSVRLARAKS
jgi:hypothetical protein